MGARARGCACLSLLFSCSCSWLSLGTGCSCLGWGETGVTGGPACSYFYLSVCLSVCPSIFSSMFLGGRARLALPVLGLRRWESALSGTVGAAAVSSRPCRALLGLLAAGSPSPPPCRGLPSAPPETRTVCQCVCPCKGWDVPGMCVPGKGTCSGW